MSNVTSAASYATSIALFMKGLATSAADAFACMPTEGKIGAALGLGTFLVNWYYRHRSDRRAERLAQAREGERRRAGRAAFSTKEAGDADSTGTDGD